MFDLSRQKELDENLKIAQERIDRGDYIESANPLRKVFEITMKLLAVTHLPLYKDKPYNKISRSETKKCYDSLYANKVITEADKELLRDIEFATNSGSHANDSTRKQYDFSDKRKQIMYKNDVECFVEFIKKYLDIVPDELITLSNEVDTVKKRSTESYKKKFKTGKLTTRKETVTTDTTREESAEVVEATVIEEPTDAVEATVVETVSSSEISTPTSPVSTASSTPILPYTSPTIPTTPYVPPTSTASAISSQSSYKGGLSQEELDKINEIVKNTLNKSYQQTNTQPQQYQQVYTKPQHVPPTSTASAISSQSSYKGGLSQEELDKINEIVKNTLNKSYQQTNTQPQQYQQVYTKPQQPQYYTVTINAILELPTRYNTFTLNNPSCYTINPDFLNKVFVEIKTIPRLVSPTRYPYYPKDNVNRLPSNPQYVQYFSTSVTLHCTNQSVLNTICNNRFMFGNPLCRLNSHYLKFTNSIFCGLIIGEILFVY